MTALPYHWASMLFSAWLLPPGLQLLMLAVSLILWRRAQFLARTLVGLALASLYLMSAPCVVQPVIQALEPDPDPIRPGINYRAVICLTGGTNFHAPESPHGQTPTNATALRCVAAAMLALEHHLPLVIAGAGYHTPPEALVARDYLYRLQLPLTLYTESVSRDTSEAPPAVLANFPSLKGPILLVTDALHSVRSKAWFEHYGFEVTAIPTRYAHFEPGLFNSLMPTGYALEQTRAVLREWGGRQLVPEGKPW